MDRRGSFAPPPKWELWCRSESRVTESFKVCEEMLANVKRTFDYEGTMSKGLSDVHFLKKKRKAEAEAEESGSLGELCIEFQKAVADLSSAVSSGIPDAAMKSFRTQIAEKEKIKKSIVSKANTGYSGLQKVQKELSKAESTYQTCKADAKNSSKKKAANTTKSVEKMAAADQDRRLKKEQVTKVEEDLVSTVVPEGLASMKNLELELHEIVREAFKAVIEADRGFVALMDAFSDAIEVANIGIDETDIDAFFLKALDETEQEIAHKSMMSIDSRMRASAMTTRSRSDSTGTSDSGDANSSIKSLPSMGSIGPGDSLVMVEEELGYGDPPMDSLPSLPPIGSMKDQNEGPNEFDDEHAAQDDEGEDTVGELKKGSGKSGINLKEKMKKKKKKLTLRKSDLKSKDFQAELEKMRGEEREKMITEMKAKEEQEASIREAEIEKIRAQVSEEVRKQILAESESMSSLGSPTEEPRTPQDRFQEVCLDAKDVDLGRVLGGGAFGDVLLGTYLGTEVAVKRLRNWETNPDSEKAFKEEFLAMKDLRHPNIVLLMGIVVDPPPFLIVTEFCSRGSLHDIIHTRKEKLNLYRIHSLLSQCAKGLAYLHGRKPQVIHRDLKAANLLLTDEWALKIADFGLSKVKEKDNVAQSVVGTVLFMAPEVMEGREYTAKCDVYSYGMIMFELFERELPFKGLNQMQVMFKVAKGERPPLTKTPEFYRPLMNLCWEKDPGRRPPFFEIMNCLEDIAEQYELSFDNPNPEKAGWNLE